MATAINPAQRGLSFAATIQDKCESFLNANPVFLEEFIRRARDLKAIGFERYSSDEILHSMRFDHAIRTRSRDGYKINNNISSRISRIAEEREPGLRGFFEKRKLRAS